MKKAVIALCVFASLGTAACAPSGKDIANALAGSVPKAKEIQGPQLDGVWLSSCLADPLSYSGKRIITLTINGVEAVHQVTRYADANCQKENAPETLKGKLVFKDTLPESVYMTELRIPIDANISTWRYFNISLKENVLAISDFFMEESDAKMAKTSIELKKQSGNTTPTNPQNNTQTNMPPKPASVVLKSGGYTSTSPTPAFCDQSVSTMAMGGKMAQVYIDFQYSCSGSATLICTDGVCSNSTYEMKVLGPDSYEFKSLRDGRTETFKKM